MKYIFLNDLKFFISKKNKLLLLYLFMILLFSLYLSFSKNDINQLYMILGVNYTLESLESIPFIFFSFNIFYSLFLSLNLFLQNSKKGCDYIFLRISYTKWITFKLISIFIFLVIVKTTIYLLTIIIMDKSILFSMNITPIFASDLLISFILSLLLIWLWVLNKKNKILMILIAFFLFILVFYLNIYRNILSLSDSLQVLFIIALSLILPLVILFKYEHAWYFE